MIALIMWVLFSQEITKENFNLIDKKDKIFYAGEIRIGWQYDNSKGVFFRYKKQDKQSICLSGFR